MGFRIGTVDRYSKVCHTLVQESLMRLLITIYQDEDGVFVADCASIPGCVSQGKSEEEAEKNIREAIKECLAVRAERGMTLTVTAREIEVPA